MLDINHAVAFTTVMLGLLVAHEVADHWVQTHYEANRKGEQSPEGRTACLSHVLSYTFTTVLFAGGIVLLFNLHITLLGFIAGQIISAVTHYVADRRYPIEWIVQKLERTAGKYSFYKLGRPRKIYAYVVPTTEKVELCEANGDVVSWDNPTLGTGAYALDQSWHKFWLFIAAIVMVVIP